MTRLALILFPIKQRRLGDAVTLQEEAMVTELHLLFSLFLCSEYLCRFVCVGTRERESVRETESEIDRKKTERREGRKVKIRGETTMREREKERGIEFGKEIVRQRGTEKVHTHTPLQLDQETARTH